MILFDTTRLYVRYFTSKDIAAFHDMESDPEVMKYTSTPKPFTWEENEQRLSELISAYQIAQPDLFVWAIVRKMDDEVVGSCAINKIPGEDKHEIGYRLRRSFQGLGYIKELVEPLISFGFHVLDLPVLCAYSFTENIPSVKILDQSSLIFQYEFFNEAYGRMDRFYERKRVEK